MIPTNLSAACESFRAEIVAMIDGELEPAHAEAVQAHIADCELCAAFHADAAAVLRLTKDAFPTSTTSIPAAGEIDRPAPQPELTDTDMVLVELRAVRAELQTMRAEITELRKQLAAARGQIAEIPARPVARPIFSYAASMDRLRSDR